MSVLVYTESEKGKFKKNAFEVASYAKAIADTTGTEVTAVAFHAEDAETLGNYGVSRVLLVKEDALDTYQEKLDEYERIFGFTAETYICSPSSGVRIVFP